MNGKLQGIIICGVTAACLVGVMAFLNSTSGKSDADSSSSSTAAVSSQDESVVILTKSSDDITSVKVSNEHGEYSVNKSESGKSTWSIPELGTLNANATAEASMISNLDGFKAKKLVEENVEDMSKYGLDKPTADLTVEYSDGTATTLHVGSVSPSNERYSYVSLDDEKTVYMVMGTKLSYYTDPVTAYANLTLLTKPSDDDWPDYGKETVTRKDLDYEMAFENNPNEIEGLSGQIMTEPIFSYLNITNSSATTHGMWGLTAQSCEVIAPDETAMKEHGLSDPFATVRLSGDGYDYTLKIGDPVYATAGDSSETTDTVSAYYCYFEGVKGVDAIYLVSADNLPWATIKAEDVITSLMTSNYLVDLKDVEVVYNGKKTVYEVESSGASTDTDSDGKTTAQVTKVTTDGKELDVDNFKTFYQYLMGCPTNEIYFTDPEGESYLTVTFDRKDGKKDVMEIYKDSSRRSVVKLNGETSFRIQSTWVDTFVANMDRLLKGEAVDDNY